MENNLSNVQLQNIYNYITMKDVTRDEGHAYIMRYIDCTYEFAKIVYGSTILFDAFRGRIGELAQK